MIPESAPILAEASEEESRRKEARYCNNMPRSTKLYMILAVILSLLMLSTMSVPVQAQPLNTDVYLRFRRNAPSNREFSLSLLFTLL